MFFIHKIILAAVLLTSYISGPPSDDPLTIGVPPSDSLIVVAHRGASGYAPENTMAAFRKAAELKADFNELDVQLSKDGRLVVIHDATVNRTTDGSGKVGDLTFRELRSLDAGSSFSSRYAGEKIPSLEEVLDAFQGSMGFLIELKSPERYPGIEQKLADALVERHLDKLQDGSLIVQSFDYEAIQRFHAILPDVPTAMLITGRHHHTKAMLKRIKARADYVNPTVDIVNSRLITAIHDLDMRVMVWTVRSRRDIAALMREGVDCIITDFPDYAPRDIINNKTTRP